MAQKEIDIDEWKRRIEKIVNSIDQYCKKIEGGEKNEKEQTSQGDTGISME